MIYSFNVEGEAPLPGSQPPYHQRPRHAAESVPLLNSYREQLLEKLPELDPSKSRQLRGIKARKTTIIKALRTLASIQAAIMVPAKWKAQTMRVNSNK